MRLVGHGEPDRRARAGGAKAGLCCLPARRSC